MLKREDARCTSLIAQLTLLHKTQHRLDLAHTLHYKTYHRYGISPHDTLHLINFPKATAQTTAPLWTQPTEVAPFFQLEHRRLYIKVADLLSFLGHE